MKPKPTEEAKQRAENYMSLKGALEPVVDSPLNIYNMKDFLNWRLTNQMYSLDYDGTTLMFIDDEEDIINDDSAELIGAKPAILFSSAFRWFREKYKIRFIIQSSMSDLGEYFKVIFPNGEQRNVSYNTYEEAEIACLNKLIEIVKKK